MRNLTHTQANPAYQISSECTIELRSGRTCDARTWPDAPFAICRDHALELFFHMRRIAKDAVVASGGALDPFKPHTASEPETPKPDSVVYYARIGDYIKIGYSANLLGRIRSLRIDRKDVLAVEPGDGRLESRRHTQFAELRIGKRENFKPTFALIRHIDAVRERHGDPKF